MTAAPPAAPVPPDRPPPPLGASTLALWTLVALALATPWPFGAVQPWAVRALLLATLLVAAGLAAFQAISAGLLRLRWPVWPLGGLLALAAFQLVPIPPTVHRLLAPASYQVWHPAAAAAAEALGRGARPISIDPFATRQWLGLAAGLTLLAVLAAPAARDAHTAVRAAAVLAAGGVAVAAYGIVARVLFGPLLYGRFAVPTVAPFGPFVSKNHFAGYAEMAALAALGLALGLAGRDGGDAPLGWVRSARAWQPLLALFAFAVIGLGILVSLSRGGMVALAAGLALFWAVRAAIAHRRGGRRTLVAALAAAGLLGALLLILPAETHERIGTLATLGQEQSAPFRLGVWRDGLRAMAASPLVGSGAGTFPDAFARFKSGWGDLRVEHAENEPVELLVEMGVVGAALAAAAVALGFRAALLGYREGKHRLLRRLGPACLAAAGALLVHELVDFNLRIPSNAVLFAAVAALAAGAAHPPLVRAGRGASIAIALASIALLAWTALAPPPPPVSSAEALRVASALDPTARRLWAARAEEGLTRALRARPADPAPWLLLAWLRAASGAPAEAAALARHAVELDPRNPALRLEAERILAQEARAGESSSAAR